MSKRHKILISILFALIISVINTPARAQEQQSFEKFWYKIGYKSIGEAITECEKLFQRGITLPTMVPSVEFTHQFGRCNNSEYNVNDSFEIEYINEHTGKKHYMIRVRPLKYKIPIKQELTKGVYTLKDKSKAILFRIRESSNLDTLTFERNGWQYMLIIDSRGLDKASSKVLVQIANTIE
ncbi:hypothetical protein [Bacillus sp. S14(2024)]|uniref:hypothetical protein n=1 Tax=Bacillus sp. S14(2024) TaxID=3162884 RepID=UPI003D22F6A5